MNARRDLDDAAASRQPFGRRRRIPVNRTLLLLAAYSIAVAGALAAFAGVHGEDFIVGQNPATGQLAVEYPLDIYPFELPPSAEPALAGFALDDPGFLSLDAVEIPNAFEPIDLDAIVRMEVLASSRPAMKVWNPLAPGTPGFQIVGANHWDIGQRPFDAHPYWHIDSSDPSYVPADAPWSVTFRLIDARAEGHVASEPITVTFLPEPATILSMIALLTLAPQRRFRRPTKSIKPRAGLSERACFCAGATHRRRLAMTPFRRMCVAAIAASAASAALAQHAGDLQIGRTQPPSGDTPVLRLGGFAADGFDPRRDIALLSPVIDTFRTVDPGFDANVAPDPADDFWPLQSGASIRLVAVADPTAALHVEYSSFRIDAAGDSIPLGDATLHRHLRFVVDASAAPPFDPLRTLWFLPVRLEDVGTTAYLPSEPFVLRFAIADCVRGDVNGDAATDNGDIDAFVAVLLDPAGATPEGRCAADTNYDGRVDNGDIDSFVLLLLG